MQQAGYEGIRKRRLKPVQKIDELNGTQTDFRYVMAHRSRNLNRDVVDELEDNGYEELPREKAEQLGIRLGKHDVVMVKPYDEWKIDKQDSLDRLRMVTPGESGDVHLKQEQGMTQVGTGKGGRTVARDKVQFRSSGNS